VDIDPSEAKRLGKEKKTKKPFGINQRQIDVQHVEGGWVAWWESLERIERCSIFHFGKRAYM
jgi:hypothetical protein